MQSDNKQLVRDLFSRFNAGDVSGALALLSEDATWWIAGKPDLNPAAGVKNKEQITKLLHRMFKQLKSGLRMQIKGMIAEDDKVAVEIESYGELNNGRIYNQQYHMAITCRDGKISEVREYLDTQHVAATWF